MARHRLIPVIGRDFPNLSEEEFSAGGYKIHTGAKTSLSEKALEKGSCEYFSYPSHFAQRHQPFDPLPVGCCEVTIPQGGNSIDDLAKVLQGFAARYGDRVHATVGISRDSMRADRLRMPSSHFCRVAGDERRFLPFPTNVERISLGFPRQDQLAETR